MPASDQIHQLPPADTVDYIVNLYATRGDDHYGEDVSQREHAEQCAWHARNDGGDDHMIVAALLHDIGHFLHKFGQDAADQGIDTKHERIGAGWLARLLPASVTDPIALHVAAKRYLATLEPGYITGLSAASVQSLKLQGGLMSAEEIAEFRAHPHHQAALDLRRYDEMGKVAGVDMPGVASYAPMIRALLIHDAPLAENAG